MTKREFIIKATQQEFIKTLASDIAEAEPISEGESIYTLQCTKGFDNKLALNVIGLPLPAEVLEKAPSLFDTLAWDGIKPHESFLDDKIKPIILVEMLQLGDRLRVKINWQDYLDSHAPGLIDPLINQFTGSNKKAWGNEAGVVGGEINIPIEIKTYTGTKTVEIPPTWEGIDCHRLRQNKKLILAYYLDDKDWSQSEVANFISTSIENVKKHKRELKIPRWG